MRGARGCGAAEGALEIMWLLARFDEMVVAGEMTAAAPAWSMTCSFKTGSSR